MWKAVKAQMSEQEQHQELPENNDDEGFDFTHVNSVARIALYDNLLSAPRVTEIQPAPVDAQPIIASLSQREKDFLAIYLKEGVLGVSDVVKLTGAAQSSVHNTLKKLEGIGLLKMSGKKRMLTNLGIQVAQLL